MTSRMQLDHNVGRHADSPSLACTDCLFFWTYVFFLAIAMGACIGAILAGAKMALA